MSDDWSNGTEAYLHRRVNILEGRAHSTEGCYIISGCRVRFGWGYINNDDWPSATYGSGPEPPGLDQIAKRQRISAYWRIDSLIEFMRCINAGPTLAAFQITHDWHNAPQGHIDMPKADSLVIGTHAVMLSGYSIPDMHVKFVNNWGLEWGDNGRGTMSFEFFQNYLREAWYFHSSKSERPERRGLACLNDGYKTPIGLFHVIALYDCDADDRFAWAMLLERGHCIELQDLFVKPQYRMRGHGKKLVGEIIKLRKERVQASSLPLLSYAYSIDTTNGPTPIMKLARLLKLELADSRVPWARFIARPEGTVWRSRRHRKNM